MTPPTQPRSTIAASIAASPSASGIVRPAPTGTRRHAVGPAQRADQSEPGAGRLEDRAEEEARHRLAAGPRHADRHELLGRVARQRLAEPRQCRPARRGRPPGAAPPRDRAARPPPPPPRAPAPGRRTRARRAATPGPPRRPGPGSSRRLSAVQPETSQSGHPTNRASGRSRRRLTEGIPRWGRRSTNQRAIGSRLLAIHLPGVRQARVPRASHPEGGGILGQEPKKGNARLGSQPMTAGWSPRDALADVASRGQVPSEADAIRIPVQPLELVGVQTSARQRSRKCSVICRFVGGSSRRLQAELATRALDR